MLLHDDVMFQILLWLPVISLFRFKVVCKSWHALIESSYFIRQHLYLHHYDPSLKDKNCNLIYLLRGEDSSISFPLTSIESFEEPNVPIFFPLTSTESFEEANIPISYALTSTERFEEPKVRLELNCSNINGCSFVEVLQALSYNGIICLHVLKNNREHSICLWNPATKQSRVLPQSPFIDNRPESIGFGFDIKNNDYKVVKIITGGRSDKMRYEVYSLNTSSWRRLTTGFSFDWFIHGSRMPFNNGTCFFWGYYRSKNVEVVCFDFSSEMFRCIPLPGADCYHVGVVNDKIACFLKTSDEQMELRVFNEYGKANESWTKVYTISPYSIIDRTPDIRPGIKGVSMNGNYIFFQTQGKMCRFNVVTKETKYFTLENMPCSYDYSTLVEFKESLVPI